MSRLGEGNGFHFETPRIGDLHFAVSMADCGKAKLFDDIVICWNCVALWNIHKLSQSDDATTNRGVFCEERCCDCRSNRANNTSVVCHQPNKMPSNTKQPNTSGQLGNITRRRKQRVVSNGLNVSPFRFAQGNVCPRRKLEMLAFSRNEQRNLIWLNERCNETTDGFKDWIYCLQC